MPPFTFTSGGGGGGGAAAANNDWIRADITDAEWTKYDPDGTATSITNVAGINKCTVGTDNNGKLEGCTWYREVLMADGSSLDHSDSPITFRGSIHLPAIGWATTGSSGGGDNRPPVASSVYVTMGLMSDPENLPIPADVLGIGLDSKTLGYRNYRRMTYNTSTSAPTGAVSDSTSALTSISDADAAAGDHSANRMDFTFMIERNEVSSDTGINIPNNPVSRWIIYRARYDNGNAYGSLQSLTPNQKWGRTRTSKLYVWISIGRSASVGSAQDLDFDCYYNVQALDGDTNPSGRTPLT